MMCENALKTNHWEDKKAKKALHPILVGQEVGLTRWSGIQDLETLIVHS